MIGTFALIEAMGLRRQLSARYHAGDRYRPSMMIDAVSKYRRPICVAAVSLYIDWGR